MANDLARNPLIVDTAGAGMVASAFRRVKQIRWVGATTAGHQAVVQDADGRVIWESIAGGANNVESTIFDPQSLRLSGGFKVPTLGSGKLYFYLSD